MNYKLEYITRLFEKTNKKRIENYVITRLWHQLNNPDIKMVPQQYVIRNGKNYALTDVYFPQFDICVEVNELAHYETQDKIDSDEIRNEEIKENISCKVYEIDCRKDLNDIHKQIDNVIEIINTDLKRQEKNNSFKAWNPDNEFSIEYWKRKGVIDVSENIGFFTIDDVCLLFEADPRKIRRGFLRKGAIAHPKKDDLIIWWPSLNQRSNWKNSYDSATGEIIEFNIDSDKNMNHLNREIQNNETRVVFLHHKDNLGFITYKYCGIYKLDVKCSEYLQKLCWKKISEKINLKTLAY